MTARRILHVDMDAFFVSVEQREDPALRGQPVVVGGIEGRGVVAAASYEARKFGVHSALPMSVALRRCPQLVVVQGNHRLYGDISRQVFHIFERFTPAIQAVSIDEAYLDLTGTERLFGPARGVATEILTRIRAELDLPASAGLAGTRVTAKIASEEAKPKGLIEVFPGYEKAFLAPLPVGRIPGVGKKMLQQLQEIGVFRIGDLMLLGEKDLRRRFGEYGGWLWTRARAEDDTPVTGEREPARSISHETTFMEDVADGDRLAGTLHRLAEKVGRRLRAQSLQARTVHLKLRYFDFTTHIRSHTFRQPVKLDTEIYQAASILFNRNYHAGIPVRLLGVGVSQLCEPVRQLDLFSGRQHRRDENINQCIDRLRDRYGFDALQVGPAVFHRRHAASPGDAENHGKELKS